MRPDQAALRGIVAPAQAADGELVAAVASTEQACAGLAANPEAPVDAVVAELRTAGRDDLALRYLAEGFLQTGRQRYGELLDQLLPARVRQRTNRMLAPLLLVVLAVLVGVTAGLRGDVAVVGVLLVTAAGLGAAGRGALTRAPGTTLAQTGRVVEAVTAYRKRVGRSSPVLPVLGAAAAGFGYGAWKGATRTTELLTRITLLPLIAGLATAAAAAVVMTVVGRRRRTRIRAGLQERVASERCRCWERDWFAGPAWHGYRDRHLATVAADQRSGATLLRCPSTAKTWLHVDDADLTVRVVLPEPVGPAQDSAAYL